MSLELNKHYFNDRNLSVYLFRYTDDGCMTRLFHYWFYIDFIDSAKFSLKEISRTARVSFAIVQGLNLPLYRIMVTTPSARCMTLNIPSPIIWSMNGAALSYPRQSQCVNCLIFESSRRCRPRSPPPLVGNQVPGCRVLILRGPW